MEWLLVAWFITASGSGLNQNLITTRMNTKSGCENVLTNGYSAGLRGVCVYDPVELGI